MALVWITVAGGVKAIALVVLLALHRDRATTARLNFMGATSSRFEAVDRNQLGAGDDRGAADRLRDDLSAAGRLNVSGAMFFTSAGLLVGCWGWSTWRCTASR